VPICTAAVARGGSNAEACRCRFGNGRAGVDGDVYFTVLKECPGWNPNELILCGNWHV
jgi:hypothetical protein